MEKIIRNTKDMEQLARELLDNLLRGSPTRDHVATVLGLSGDLGAGKTVFAKSMARVLAINESVPSPTFVIARFYDIPNNEHFHRLVHIDAYRIESEDELRPIGWDKILADPTNLVLVEWPEKMGDQFPHDARKITFEVIDETTRRICDEVK